MYFIFLVVTAFSSDIGLIGFFNISCPTGWRQWEQGAGRVIVVEGYASFDKQIRNFSLGETGGEHTHQMTLEEMPAHQHQQGSAGILNYFGGGIYGGRGGFGGDEHDVWHKQYTSTVGNSKAFNVRDPDLVLKAC